MTNNSEIECVVFDLDGTITMSHESIYKATIKALEECNLPIDFPKDVFYKRIGLHFEDIFNEFGIEVNDLERFIKIYKSYYFDFIDATKLYPGVTEALNQLKANGIKSALLTTKGQDQAEKILNHFQLADRFDIIVGRRPGMGHKPSPEPLLYICSELNVNPGKTLMVGDSEMDIRCAKNAASLSCAVTFGYRTKEKLLEENPDYLIDNFIEITNIINHK